MASKQALQQAAEHNVTADRVLGAIEALVFGPTSAPRIADAIGVHPRTARRIVRTLERAEYAVRLTGRGRTAHQFQPTVRLLAMAAQLAARLPLVQHARDAVHRLEAATDLTAYVAVPSYGDVLVIAASGRRLQPWTLLPALEDAAGRMLLAHRDRWRASVVSDPHEYPSSDVAHNLDRGHVLSQSRDFGASLAVAIPDATVAPITAIGVRGRHDELKAQERELTELLQSEALALDADADQTGHA